jgi:DNA-binding winged helix-turn-helix (wHTH) protein
MATRVAEALLQHDLEEVLMLIDGHPSLAGTYQFDGFVLDVGRRGLWRPDGTPVKLTPRLFNTLLLFVEHPGELLGKDWLMSRLWPGTYVVENSLSQIISALRRSLARDGRVYIQTESRYGFRFVCPVKAMPPSQFAVGAETIPTAMETLSFTLSVQIVILKHLADALTPHLHDAAPEKRTFATLGGIGGREPSRTPAFPL